MPVLVWIEDRGRHLMSSYRHIAKRMTIEASPNKLPACQCRQHLDKSSATRRKLTKTIRLVPIDRPGSVVSPGMTKVCYRIGTGLLRR